MFSLALPLATSLRLVPFPAYRTLLPLAATRLAAWLGLCLTLSLPAVLAAAPAQSAAEGDFAPLVKLAPFVVAGDQLSISIHARSGRDRRYAEEFAEQVIKVVYTSVTEETGKGLVIIGRKGEPHPVFVFRKFLALAKAGKLDPAVAARGPELFKMLNRWQHTVDDKRGAGGKEDPAEGEVDLKFEKIATALPLPLEGIGAKLYQLAWAEKFDDAKIEAKLRALQAADLERDWFAHFDWVFYLPPKGAFDRALDDLIAEAMKEDDVGVFARTAVKGVMLVVKPKIRQAIEALRRGLLFMTVVQARTTYAEADVSALTAAYIEAQMPGEKYRGTVHDHAVQAVRDQMKRNAEKARTDSDKAPSDTETEPDPAAD